jgi:hypothetical protein
MAKRKQVGFVTMGASTGGKKIKEIGVGMLGYGYRTAEVCEAILISAKSGRREGVRSRADKPKRARRRVSAGSRLAP